MINAIKKIIFKLYLFYMSHFPIQRGKYRIGIFLLNTLKYAVYKIDGILIGLNPFSYIDKRLIGGQDFDKEVSDLIGQTLQRGGFFLDVGANIGYFSLLAARMPNVQVISFEPSPRELRRLYHNIYLNKFTNITVFPYGLSDTHSTADFYLFSMLNPGGNSLVIHDEYSMKVTCQLVPFDMIMPAVFLDAVKLCKIDVEGFELFVLRGMSRSIKFMRNAVFIVEIIPAYMKKAGYEPGEVYDFFAQHGYQPQYGISALREWNEIFTRDNDV
jgi:FkbM family methyltransferase